MLQAASLRTLSEQPLAGRPAWRRGPLAGLAAVVAGLHLLILGGLDPGPGRRPERPGAPAAVTARIVATVEASPDGASNGAAASEAPSVTPDRQGSIPSVGPSAAAEAPALSPGARAPAPPRGTALRTRPPTPEPRAGQEPKARPERPRAGTHEPTPSKDSSDRPPPADDQAAPPIYRTQLPPPATLHYEVWRRGERGTGELRWRASDGTYRLELAAHIGDAHLLAQSSQGRIDDAGLAPDRFLDRRARRAAQSVDFRRAEGRVTFSGAAPERPLLAGTQDRLSWMFQLAGIAAAEPARVEAGALVRMAVVGARGDASVWSLRSTGLAAVETAEGIVPAVRLVREAWTGYDSGFEIWLDPARGYLPVRATQRSARGEPEFDLRLLDLQPGS